MMTLNTSTDFDPHSQLVRHIVDHFAATKPVAVYAEYPRNLTSYEDGYQSVTYKTLAIAINGLTHLPVGHLGPGRGEVLTYVGPNDLRYPALILEAVKAGYCVWQTFLTSPRNSPVTHQSLLQKLGCTTLIAPVPRPPAAAAILEAVSLQVLGILSMEELTYLEAALQPLVIIRTSSGSTGIPQPIKWIHETTVKHMRMQTMMLHPFHAGGVGHLSFVTMPVELELVMPLSRSLPTAAGMVAARKHTPFSFTFVTLSIVSKLAQTPELLDFVHTHLDFLGYCGGDLPQTIGDTVAERIKLVNIYGATDMGLISAIHSTTDRDPTRDWRYTRFHPQLGVQMRHVLEHELVMVRTPEYGRHQFPFSIADLWRTTSRLDDMIVFFNGEKTNPILMEQHIVAANREVTGCLVAGAQRFQAALNVELGKAELALNEANRACPAHARIAKSHILFTTPEKPMLRAGKGTVQRAGTLAQATGGMVAGPGSVDDASQVTAYVRTSILAITGWNYLQTITLTRELNFGLNLPAIMPNLIYLHLAVTALTQAVHKLGRAANRIPDDCASRSATRPSTQTVVLTGSTGQLGSYILHALLSNPSVAHIHCLNRKKRARETQHECMVTYGLTPLANHESRVSFWIADFSRADLGLQRRVFKQLHPTSGRGDLINFTARSPLSPHLFFLSSISSIIGHYTDSSLTSETMIASTHCVPTGCANSKYIAKHLLARAALFRSSWHLETLPGTLSSPLDRIDWVLIDLLAEVIVDLALLGGAMDGSARGQLQVYHPINLHPKSWDEVLPVVAKELAARSGVDELDIVPLREWVQRVRLDVETAGRGEDRKKLNEKELRLLLAWKPAAKLLEFFEGLVGHTEAENALETVRTAEISGRLQEVEGVQPERIRKWIGEWLD
ncbi:hypothetical protein ASPACDRAFT_53653 [Aspergillus aculeatus ATCC 16872]|uniref:Thioester reductase (TE) domain-containing protein n=1 Tax=Aspergillus aculeatus (strain ATCC 16872 / CBS 172.66 / WB 5094) TaxID=690307 RepID=A0A1L9WMM9_ASPA1|nr:uncharacterized protein ASPACDRAFT_53653 [Aspergillus aculeatus ATCC 16872]OJJ97423.1 hypothetical protein ASPACDRAFT_53653 [Aspergillus aculeatus ATCC 16872]